MTKDELEILLADKPIEAKTRGAVLYNAVGATMQAYNADRSVANLRNMDAAKDAFDKFVAEIGGNVNKDRFENLHAVLSFLQDSGWKIKKTNLYQHRKDGKLIPDSDGTFARAAVEKYARTFLKQTATGKRVTEATDDLQRKILTQQTQINDLKIKQQERRNAIEEKKFVSVQIVLDAAFTMFRHTRDAMMNIPDRIAEIVAAETNPVKVREILTTELRQSLERLEKPEVLIEH